MSKYKLVQTKKRLLALGLAGVIFGTSGCANYNQKNEEPSRIAIPKEYSDIESYYKYAIKNEKAVKLYNSQNVYLLYNKDTYEVNEYIYSSVALFGPTELYDLETEEMLVYSSGIGTTYNENFYNYLRENNYQVCLNEVNDYVEDFETKEYYSIDDIKELEPQIEEGLKIINQVKNKSRKISSSNSKK